jgi:uncharacterized protein YgbK (DUF1537 family)
MRHSLGGTKMKQITERQIEAIEKLAKATKTEVNVEGMSSFEASQTIEGLIEKLKEMRKQNGFIAYSRRQNSNGFSSDALAGLAVKILAQRHKVQDIISQRDNFKQRVKELYEVFSEARQGCLAS